MNRKVAGYDSNKHTRTLHPLQQQQQGMEFGMCVIVMDNRCTAASRAGLEQIAPHCGLLETYG